MYADEIGFGESGFEVDVFDLSPVLLDTAFMAQIHHALYTCDVLMILVSRVVAQDVHIHSCALLDHRQSDSPGANDGHSFARNFVSQKGKKRMPGSPAIFAH